MGDSRPTFYGSFRESNAFHLELLERATLVGLPIEVDIYDGAAPATMLATLENARGVSFAAVKDDVGSGQFTLPFDDPKAVYLVRGNLVKFKLGGVYRFAIWLDEPKLIPAAEGSAARYECGGQGVLSYLGRAVLYAQQVYTAKPLGAVMYGAIQAQLAKTPTPYPSLTIDFSDTLDSQGALWTDAVGLTLSAGASVGDVWKQLMALGLEGEMTHALQLRAFIEMGVHRDGSGGAEPVVLRQGRHILVDPELVGRGGDLRSRVLVLGDGGTTLEVADTDIETDPRIGRRETSLSLSGADATAMQRGGEMLIAALLNESGALRLPLVHGLEPGDVEPFVDFNLGDWILVDVPDVMEMALHRVVGIQVEQGETPFDWSCTVDLNSYSLEADLRLKRQLDALGGGTMGGGGVTNVSLGSGNAGGGAGSGKVSVELADVPRYLYDKIAEGAGITKSIVGAAGDRQLQLALVPGEALVVQGAVVAVIDGGGVPFGTGVKLDIGPFPFDCTLLDWTLLGDQAGAVVLDLWSDTYANFPPTVTDAITGGAKPTIPASNAKAQGDCSAWEADVAAGDIIRVNVDSVTALLRVELLLHYERTI